MKTPYFYEQINLLETYKSLDILSERGNDHLNEYITIKTTLRNTDTDEERNKKILYWAKELENKKLSLHELFENAKWLLDNIK